MRIPNQTKTTHDHVFAGCATPRDRMASQQQASGMQVAGRARTDAGTTFHAARPAATSPTAIGAARTTPARRARVILGSWSAWRGADRVGRVEILRPECHDED